jgi:hypothetical protein
VAWKQRERLRGYRLSARFAAACRAARLAARRDDAAGAAAAADAGAAAASAPAAPEVAAGDVPDAATQGFTRLGRRLGGLARRRRL